MCVVFINWVDSSNLRWYDAVFGFGYSDRFFCTFSLKCVILFVVAY